MVLILGMAGPFLRESGRAGERDSPVNDKNAPMRSAIGAVHSPRGGRVIVGEFAPRLLHHLDVRIVETPTRNDAAQKNADFDAGAGPFAKGVAKLPADLVRMQNVGGKIDRLPGGSNRLQHGRKIFLPIEQNPDLIARNWDRVRKGQGGSEDLRIPDREGVFEVIFERMTADKKEAKDQDDRQKGENQADPFAHGQFPPALIQPMRGMGTFASHDVPSELNRAGGT